ncbi:MAG: AAA-like domain-containing protein, partial [Rivularia sp. (in: cyanobacteria)]
LISSVWHISRSWRSQRLLHVSYTSIKITQSTILPQKTFARGLLYSMGLVRWHGNEVEPRCDLYRLYLHDCLLA